MNLYGIRDTGDDWCCYVFAETRNKAKSMLVGYFSDNEEYIDFRSWTVKQNVDGEAEICDEQCRRLDDLGVHYLNGPDFLTAEDKQ